MQNVRNGQQPNVTRVEKGAIKMAQISKKMKTKRAHLVDTKKMEAQKSREEELEEICVVGYQCKLFRDDERALAIDRGEHLIPWMGDTSLMIDRYDCRGHLPSLSEHQSGWVDSRRPMLTAEEERIEALCDEERYMALHKDMMEEEQRQEEEIKRFNMAIASSDSSYNEVAFSYDEGKDEYDPMRPTEDEEQFPKTPPKCKSPEPEEPFIAPAEMNIPMGVEMPGTKKTHKFMEKTARFILRQGAQMEIILKTKQANNPQFDFLHFDHYLNPYYKHLLKLIKSGRYKGLPEDQEEDNHKKQGGNNRVRKHSNHSSSGGDDDDDDDDDNDNSGYLHPSLLGRSRPKPTPMQAGTTTIQTSTSVPLASSYHHPPMDFSKPPPVMGYHDSNILPPAVDPSFVTPSGYYDQSGVYPMFQPPPPPPPSDAGAALSLPTVPPPHFSGVDPAYVLPNPPPSIHPGLGHPTLGLDPSVHVLPLQESPSVPPTAAGPMGSIPSADISEAEVPGVIPPPPDIQPIIDKLAKFVAKNGMDFEASVRSKSDPRFDFLLPWHKYNAYYVQKKNIFVKEMGGKTEEEAGESKEEKMKKVAVSFSIKPKMSKEERPLERKSALPIESSDSEEEEEKPPPRLPPPESLIDFVRTAMPPQLGRPIRAGPEDRDLRREVRGDDPEVQRLWSDFPGQPPFNPAFRGQQFPDRTNLPPHEGPYQESAYREPAYREPPSLGYSEHSDPSTERDGVRSKGPHDRGRMSEEEWQMKQAKMRLEDRLASAAREKLASASKERIQQMERRKKAAVFLSMIKDRPQAGAAAELDSMETAPTAEPNNIPMETVSPAEKQRKTDSKGERKKHKKHKHRHGGSRRSPSPDKKHKTPPRSYQDAYRLAREGNGKLRSRSTSPGGRLRPAIPPKSYQTTRKRSPKRRRRSRSRSNSPVQPLRTDLAPRRSSNLGVTSLPTKSRSLSPENGRDVTHMSVTPLILDAAPPPPGVPPPPPSATSANPLRDDGSISNLSRDPPKEMSEENRSSATAPMTADMSFQDTFRAKIRAMLAATRTFEPS